MKPLNDLWGVLQALTTYAGHFVLIETEVPVRMCSWGDVVWQDELWTKGMIFNISMQETAPWAPGGSIEIADPDYSVLATMFRSGIVGAPIKIWYVPDLSGGVEPVLILDAFADTTTTNEKEKGSTVVVTIVPDDGAHLFAPRERVSTDEYPRALAPGATISISNGQITLVGSPL
ncbi:MAG: hypothetical protein LBE75_01815 [Burkholderiales bacterium]|jgi:hypothetical protein|nr:hypothetical protein [Burkholderiales bacterium]